MTMLEFANNRTGNPNLNENLRAAGIKFLTNRLIPTKNSFFIMVLKAIGIDGASHFNDADAAKMGLRPYSFEEGKVSSKYYLTKNFDINKPTVMYFHMNHGLGKKQIAGLSQKYNILCFEFPGYNKNHKDPNKPKGTSDSYDLNYLIKQSKLILERAEEVLKGESFYGKDYKREEDLTFVGRSLGTLVATKLASKLEQENSGVKCLINSVSPINMEVAAKTVASNAGKDATTLLAKLAGICYLTYKACKSVLRISTSFSFISERMRASSKMLVPEVAFKEAKNIGIQKEDLEGLQKTPVHFVIPHGDAFATVEDTKNLCKINDKIAVHEINKPAQTPKKKPPTSIFSFLPAIFVHKNCKMQDEKICDIMTNVYNNQPKSER